MTDHAEAPELIWVFPCQGCTMLAAETEQYNADAVAYTRSDLCITRAEADAMVAAALGRAVEKVPSGWLGYPYCSNMDYGPHVSAHAKTDIRALITPDARAALDAHTREAVRRALEGAANIVRQKHVEWVRSTGRDPEDYTSPHSWVEADIRALDPDQFIVGGNDGSYGG